MRRALVTCGVVAFSATLAIVVGYRMSAEAMAVVVGVVCGVLAGIPASLLILWAIGRRERREERTGLYPPVVVINPGTPMHTSPQFQSLWPPALTSPTPRQFKVIGEEETRVEAGQWTSTDH